jgi:hypothetical protein
MARERANSMALPPDGIDKRAAIRRTDDVRGAKARFHEALME